MGDNIAFSAGGGDGDCGCCLAGVEFASFSLFFNFESGRTLTAEAFMDEAGLAAGASEVGPPRALEEAVADA